MAINCYTPPHDKCDRAEFCSDSEAVEAAMDQELESINRLQKRVTRSKADRVDQLESRLTQHTTMLQRCLAETPPGSLKVALEQYLDQNGIPRMPTARQEETA